MADPTTYTVTFDFSGFQATNPADPLPGPSLDNELANIATSIDELVDAMTDIRRSDGVLKNGLVTLDSLADEVRDQMGGQGDAATIEIGTVTTGAPGSAAVVENVGTENAAVLNFTLPRGATGPAGEGNGDMLEATYDPTGVVGDAFDMDNMADGASKVAMTTAERAKLSGVEAAADVTDATNVAAAIHGASDKTTPADADTLPLIDSAASNVLKKLTWANLVSAIQTAFSAVFASTSTTITGSGLASGGGSLSANRIITVEAASQSEAEAGTNNTKGMTPLRTAQAIAALGITNTIAGLKVYTSSGTYTPTSGASKALVFCTGGGGGGFGGDGGGGAGGGAGGTAIDLVTISGNVSVTIGSGGNGGFGAPTNGGTSSFGAFCSASGGSAGNSANNATGGIGSNGIVNLRGGAGPTNNSITAGTSFWGGIGAYGSGGSAAADGTDGVVMVIEFY